MKHLMTTRPFPRVGLVIVLAITCVDLLPLPLQAFAQPKSIVYDAIPAHSGAVLTIPFDPDDGNNMYTQWVTQRPSVTGYLPRTNPELVNTGLMTKADGVVQFTLPITTITVLNNDPASALVHLMDTLQVEYVIYDNRFGVPVHPDVLAQLQPVVHDAHLALYRRSPLPPQPGALIVLNHGWFPPEHDRAGRRWQWSTRTGAFWLYQASIPRRAAIVTALLSVPAPMRVTFDGMGMTQALSFAIPQPQLVRRYHVLVFPHSAAADYWLTVDQLFAARDRQIGVALDALSAQLTQLTLP